VREWGDRQTAGNYTLKGFVVCIRWVGHAARIEDFGTDD